MLVAINRQIDVLRESAEQLNVLYEKAALRREAEMVWDNTVVLFDTAKDAVDRWQEEPRAA